MNCNQAEPVLNALADRELNPWQARRVRRHLAACPACAAQLDAIQRLDAAVLAWRDVPVPVPQTSRRSFSVRPAAVGLTSLAATVTAVFWFLPGQPGQPTIAFADVQQAMQKVQIVSWTNYGIAADASWHPMRANGAKCVIWVRRDPPAIATIGQPPGFAMLEDKRGLLERTAQGNYTVRPWGHQGERTIAEKVENIIKSFTQGPPPAQVSGSSHAVYIITLKPLHQTVVLNQQQRILFMQDSEVITRASRPTQEMHTFFYNYTWVDPETRLVDRIKSCIWSDNFFGPSLQRQINVSENFHYNQAPPPGVFDWSPPKGAKVRRF